MNESTKIQGLVQVSVRIVVAAGIALLISFGIFGVGDACAGVVGEEVVMECPAEKEKKITLKVMDNIVNLKINGCYCTNERENAKRKLLELLSGKGDFTPSRGVNELQVIFGPIPIEAGETITKTYYCYSGEQIEKLLQGDN